jgi:two-component system, NtrC family, response regulator PilR
VLELQVFREGRLIQRTVLHKGRITLGRAPDSDVVLNNPHVSRRHAVIGWRDDGYTVTDVSRNGLLLDGRRLTGEAPLPPSCRLGIHPFEVRCFEQNDDVTLPIDRRRVAPPPEVDGAAESPVDLHFGLLVGESAPMRAVYELIEAVADSNATVLIRGEPGTGKDLVARAIHGAGPRRMGPFVAVNCAAIPVELTESELFGYEKGAFTGALHAQDGKVAAAEGGTLFLDEIGDLSVPAQSKLLRFLQSHTFMRIGSAREVEADVRVLAATNQALEEGVQGGGFRADLLHRIDVLRIDLPALRDRRGDIPALAVHVLAELAGETGLGVPSRLTEAALARLAAAPWPGNVRELYNTLHSALVRSRGAEVLDADDLGALQADGPALGRAGEAPMDEAERRVLLDTLAACDWDTVAAAERLQVSRGTIYYRLKKYGIDIRRESRGASEA